MIFDGYPELGKTIITLHFQSSNDYFQKNMIQSRPEGLHFIIFEKVI